MRILMLTDWNQAYGGLERYVAELREGLTQAGDEVRLLTSSAGDAGHGTADYVGWGTNSRVLQAGLQLNNPFAARTVRRAAREFRPDVALVFMFALQLSPSAIRALGSVPKLASISDYKPICPISTRLLPDRSLCRYPEGIACLRTGCVGPAHWLRDQPRYYLIRNALRKTDQVITCSRWMVAQLQAHGIQAELVSLASNPPPKSFKRVPTADPTFLYRGRLDVEKGVDVLLRAFALLVDDWPNARLDILGRGPMKDQLEALVGTLRIADSVCFHGWKQTGEMWPFLQRSWSQIVPSLWAEPLGLVAVESVHCGVPTVVSRDGGLVDVVRDGIGGLHVANGDVQALHRAMETIASRRAFSDHTVPSDEIARVRREFDWASHVREIRRRCRRIA